MEVIEKKIIGGLIDSPVNLDEVSTMIHAYMFLERKGQIVYQSLIDLYTANKGIDEITVFQDIAKKGLAKEVTAHDVSSMKGFVTIDVITEYAKTIKEAWIKRRLGGFSDQLKHNAKEPNVDAFDVLDSLYSVADSIYEGINNNESFSTFDQELIKAVKDIDQERSGGFSGVPSGLIDLDNLTNGFQQTDLIILAARPAMGKSALMTTMIRNAADRGHSVGVFSLEMSKFQIVCRIISEQVNISANELTKRKLSDYQRKMFREQINNIRSLPICINDSTKMTITTLKAELKQMRKRNGVNICFVDYLQLMSGDGREGSREQEISKISRGLKELAKELSIPIIALSQLSRKVDEREGHKPYLSDLRESGSLEQDADMVLFLYRPFYYMQAKNELAEYPTQEKEAFLNIAKHRNGEVKNIQLMFDGAFSKFYDAPNEVLAPF